MAAVGVLVWCCVVSIQAQAATVVMTFEKDDRTGNPMPGALFPDSFAPLNRAYQENGMQATAVRFNDGSTLSHVHGINGRHGNGRALQLGPDAGGGLIRAANGSHFGLVSWDIDVLSLNLAEPNASGKATFTNSAPPVYVMGYLDNSPVAFASLDKSFAPSKTAMTTVDFHALDPNFDDVDKVTFWYSIAGQGVDPQNFLPLTLGLDYVIDNVTVNVSSVPLPGAAWMFAPGFAALMGWARRKG